MVRARKRHVQQDLDFRPDRRGGKRDRAGRPRVNERKSQPHRKRDELRPNTPVHVTLRVADYMRRLRRRDAYRALRKAMQAVLARVDFRIVHLSVQTNHVHLIAEADSKMALARGMQAFQISAARRINAAELDGAGRARHGAVFPDRYHVEVLTGPRKARNALSYVLNNWRKHREDRVPATRTWVIDPYSTARYFTGWSERLRLVEQGAHARWSRALAQLPEDLEPLPSCTPQSWLLREGWQRGGQVSMFEVPSRR